MVDRVLTEGKAVSARFRSEERTHRVKAATTAARTNPNLILNTERGRKRKRGEAKCHIDSHIISIRYATTLLL
jgi:hypothetical protein